MTQTQKTSKKVQPEQTLENVLLNIGQLNETLVQINSAKDLESKTNFYKLASRLISGQDAGEEKYERAFSQLTKDPVYAYDQISGTIDSRVNAVTEMYNAGKENIKKQIENEINKTLKECKDDKAKAASNLVPYLINVLMEDPNITQDEADRIEENAIYSMGMPHAFDARGNISKIKEMHFRMATGEYLVEQKNKEGKVLNYKIDTEKLGKVMDNMKVASHLYARVKGQERVREAQEAATREA